MLEYVLAVACFVTEIMWQPCGLKRRGPTISSLRYGPAEIDMLVKLLIFNPLTPNDDYSGRTAPLTSKRCILYIY